MSQQPATNGSSEARRRYYVFLAMFFVGWGFIMLFGPNNLGSVVGGLVLVSFGALGLFHRREFVDHVRSMHRWGYPHSEFTQHLSFVVVCVIHVFCGIAFIVNPMQRLR